jgi:hypothetical protein
MNPFDPYTDPNSYDPAANTAGGLPPPPSAQAPDWRGYAAIPDLTRMVGMPSPYAAMMQQRSRSQQQAQNWQASQQSLAGQNPTSFDATRC